MTQVPCEAHLTVSHKAVDVRLEFNRTNLKLGGRRAALLKGV